MENTGGGLTRGIVLVRGAVSGKCGERRKQNFMKLDCGWSLILLAGVGLMSSSCEEARQTPFNEADYQWARGAGSGAVRGKAFIEMKDNSVNVASDTDIVLIPANAYTTEFMTRQAQHGAHLAPADPRAEKYARHTTADGNGNFSFRNLPPGNYYVGTMVNWINRYWSPDSDNNLQKVSTHHAQYIWASVSVRNGQTMAVTDWNQGADRNLDDIIH